MKKNLFLALLSATFVNSASISAASAFVSETPSNVLTLAGSYSGAYAHTHAEVRVGEALSPLKINVTLTPDGVKTKLGVACEGGSATYLTFGRGTAAKDFPVMLVSTESNALQLEEEGVPSDSKGKLRVICMERGIPLTFMLDFSGLTQLPAGSAPQLSLAGDGRRQFPIASIVPKDGVLVARGPAAEEFKLGGLDFSRATKDDVIELLRRLALSMPQTLATFTLESKTDADGTETAFTIKVKK